MCNHPLIVDAIRQVLVSEQRLGQGQWELPDLAIALAVNDCHIWKWLSSLAPDGDCEYEACFQGRNRSLEMYMEAKI
jgi:hypothetical protein